MIGLWIGLKYRERLGRALLVWDDYVDVEGKQIHHPGHLTNQPCSGFDFFKLFSASFVENAKILRNIKVFSLA